jgi:ubiquitin conjugation factor E4 A
MVPSTEGETLQCDESYTFMTECFFMTHYCLRLGFRVMHERLVKLNQEVHRIQQVYQDIAQQGGEPETIDRLKENMEKGDERNFF